MALDVWQWADLVARAEAALDGERPALVITSVNLDHLYRFGGTGETLPARTGPVEWTHVLDGRPAAWAVRARARDRSLELLPGSELLPTLLAAAATRGARIGLVGGSVETRAAWGPTVEQDFPGTVVAGLWEVDWAWLDLPGHGAALAAAVAAAEVDLLVVALGKPRQERWLRDHVPSTGVRLALPFGSAAEYVAGTGTRPPVWASDHGLEWLVRLCREPRRLWRRYLIQAPVGLARLARTRIVEEPGRDGIGA